MPPPRVLVVADTHLSVDAPETLANWDGVLSHARDLAPDLVLHAGDLTLDGAHQVSELDAARVQLDRFGEVGLPWRAVPGNHDIGDNPHADLPAGEAVDPDRLAGWRDALGADWWSLELDGWTMVAVNAQLFDSGLPAEAEQWAWLGDQLADLGPDRPVALVTHKPLTGTPADLELSPPSRFVAASARTRIDQLPGAERVALVVSGHVHQSRVLDAAGRRHVWAPTTWAVLPDATQPVFGAKRCGVVVITLGEDRSVEVDIVEPAGVDQHVLGEDIPNPYGH